MTLNIVVYESVFHRVHHRQPTAETLIYSHRFWFISYLFWSRLKYLGNIYGSGSFPLVRE